MRGVEGPEVVELDEVGSTQDEARRRYRGRPLLISAVRQTSGRGREGRPWATAPRALAATLAFEPDWPPETWGRLPLVAGLAARAVLPGKPGLKWPNDLVTKEGKVGGVLLESSSGLIVAGVGVNLYWPDPSPGAAALLDFDPGQSKAKAYAIDWSEEFVGRLDHGPAHWGRSEYLAACTTLGQRITWEPDGAGLALNVAEDGSLVVDSSDDVVHLTVSEVRHVRAAGHTR